MFYEQIYTTSEYKYTDFKLPSIIFIDFVNDQGIDDDEDGLYNNLKVTASFNITLKGNYSISAGLYLPDSDRTKIDLTRNQSFFNVGIHSIDLYFNGSKIYQKGFTGPYFISGLYAYNMDDLTLKYKVNKWGAIYWTERYLPSEFVH